MTECSAAPRFGTSHLTWMCRLHPFGNQATKAFALAHGFASWSRDQFAFVEDKEAQAFSSSSSSWKPRLATFRSRKESDTWGERPTQVRE